MKQSIKDTVRELIEPTVTELGYRIWDVTYSKIGADYHLEITIDNDEGINIDDCERVHRAIDPLLDEQDPIESFYYLEVSSPGVERELRTAEHIRLSLGAKAEAKLFTAKDGKKSYRGELVDFDGDAVKIDDGETVTEIRLSEISKLTTVYFE
jgi:ribosome maturation factor RimP